MFFSNRFYDRSRKPLTSVTGMMAASSFNKKSLNRTHPTVPWNLLEIQDTSR